MAHFHRHMDAMAQIYIVQGPIHEILVLNAYAQKPLINAHVDISSKTTGLIFGQSLHLHPYLMYANSEGSGADSSEASLLFLLNQDFTTTTEF